LPPKISCEDFLLWTNANQLSHLHTIGAHFTWTNGRAGNGYVALRLDRAISNHAWLSLRAWNKTVFGNIDTNVKIATDEVIRIQT
jgi:hypothetical protein